MLPTCHRFWDFRRDQIVANDVDTLQEFYEAVHPFAFPPGSLVLLFSLF
jgi:hypothetical protein